jgi:hypothetical protein
LARFGPNACQSKQYTTPTSLLSTGSIIDKEKQSEQHAKEKSTKTGALFCCNLG